MSADVVPSKNAVVSQLVGKELIVDGLLFSIGLIFQKFSSLPVSGCPELTCNGIPLVGF